MPPVSRKGDIASGHGCFPPTTVVSASPTVYVDGISIARQGDAVAPHGCGNCPPHPRSISGGSGKIYVNGKPVARKGDAIGCGGVLIGASSSVFVNE